MDGGSDGQGEWDPFGRAIFDDPATRGLDRVGVIDVGSNSVRLVVFDGAARSPAYFYNEKVMAGLGAGLVDTGMLNPEGRVRALGAIRRFVALAEGMNLPPLTAVATAAMRSAKDAPEFHAEIEKITGLPLHVIDGDEEARFSAQGVLLGWPSATGLVCDIGGSSMELAVVGNGRVSTRTSSDLGPLRLRGLKGGASGRRREIKATLEKLHEDFGDQAKLFLVGGSWRAIARLDMLRRGYPLSVLHDYRMRPAEIRETINWIQDKDLDVLRKQAGLSSDRIALVPYAGEVLRRLMATFHVKQVVTSAYGLREGLLYEQMPHRVRRRDPLIEAARHAEATNARLPGFGRTLFSFVQPLCSGMRVKPRLVQTACLLHDVSWRAHPDYRAEVCFDNATRGNLGGIDHQGRVFLGLALLHRYRNARPGHRFEPLLELIDDTAKREAEILGKAMRFGAMFSLAVPERMGRLEFRPKKKELELHLPPAAQDLFGEVAQARFASLARALQATTRVVHTRAPK